MHDKTRPIPTTASPLIDERTCADLDLDGLLRTIAANQASPLRSLPGEAELRRLLRTVPAGPLAGAERLVLVNDFSAAPDLRRRINRGLEKLGRPRHATVECLLNAPPSPVDNRLRWLFAALGFLGLASLAAPFILGGYGFVAITLPIVLLNVWIHYHWKARSEYHAPSFFYLGRMIATGRDLAGLAGQKAIAGSSLARRLEFLGEFCAGLEPLRKRTRFFSPPRWFSGDIADVLGEYLRILTLSEVTAYLFVNNHIAAHTDSLHRLFGLLGELDALQAVSGWRQEMPVWCRAELGSPVGTATGNANVLASGAQLEAEGLFHPLLPAGVANSVLLQRRGTVFSGTNMSGKSTFLRTIALNQILAQSLGLACATRFASRTRLVATSMNRTDSLEDGDSLYLAETKRILALLRLAESGAPVLLAIDEILSGTNSHERIKAGTEIIRHLATGGFDCLILTATHDLEIPASLGEHCASWHFTDQVGPQGLCFDYRLRPGIVRERNAIRLLDHLGYPEAIMAKLRE